MKRTQRKPSRAREWLAALFLAAGIAGVGLWAASNVVPLVWQDWGNWVFEREIRGQTATVAGYLADRHERAVRGAIAWLGFEVRTEIAPGTDSGVRSPSAMGNHGLIGRLEIPRLHVTAIVREGTGEDTLSLAVGHIPGTAFPGQNGNVGVAGHRDTLFRSLREIHKNDVIQFETFRGTYQYAVASTEIVKPKDVRVLRRGPTAELTLVTCYPFNYIGSAPDRFIVKARLISRQESGQESESPNLLTVAEEKPLPRRDPGKVFFTVIKGSSRTLAPGISLGIDDTDVDEQQANGWMWIMPDRRTIWLRDQAAEAPVIFYGHQDGKRRELRITRVTPGSVTGYLLLPD